MQENQVSARDIILSIRRNMRKSLEPLVTKILAPSLYEVRLHQSDFERLESIFPEVEKEAKALLDREVDASASSPSAALQRLVERIRDPAGGGLPPQRIESPEGAWFITFREDPDDRLQPGDLEVVSDFATGPTPLYGVGSKTQRISTLRRGDGQTTTRRQLLDEHESYARIEYSDERGRQVFQVTKPEIVIGRGSEADGHWVDIRLEASEVSREHARFRRDPKSGKFSIKSLGQNGTTVNGEQVPDSLDTSGSEPRDRDIWHPLPATARVGLADVIVLDFELLASTT